MANLGYLELSFVVDQNQLSDVEFVLQDLLDPLSISIEDFDLDGIDEQAIYLEPSPSGIGVNQSDYRSVMWNKNRLSVLLQPKLEVNTMAVNPSSVSQFDLDVYSILVFSVLEKIWAQLCITAPEITHRWISDEDWVSLTQKQFQPILLGKKLWISPSWYERPSVSESNRHVIWIDPGMAFGTGGHATTHLCLEWLDSFGITNKTVLDYGCGSGILAIASSKLGACSVLGVDLDPKAVVVAQQNAVKNELDQNVSSWLTVDLFDEALKNEVIGPDYDVVVANILANPLKLLAFKLTSLVGKNGYLVLSGVLERQAEEVCLVYKQAGIDLNPVFFLDGWALLVAKNG